MNRLVALFPILVAVLACLFSQHAIPAQPPTDTELRVAYCLQVNKAVVDEVGRNAETKRPPEIMLQTGREALDRFNRLRAYLSPRLPYIDNGALLAASKRAQLDAISITEQNRKCASVIGDRCNDHQPLEHPSAKCIEALTDYQACAKGELNDRWLGCTDLSWLPF